MVRRINLVFFPDIVASERQKTLAASLLPGFCLNDEILFPNCMNPLSVMFLYAFDLPNSAVATWPLRIIGRPSKMKSW